MFVDKVHTEMQKINSRLKANIRWVLLHIGKVYLMKKGKNGGGGMCPRWIGSWLEFQSFHFGWVDIEYHVSCMKKFLDWIQ